MNGTCGGEFYNTWLFIFNTEVYIMVVLSMARVTMVMDTLSTYLVMDYSTTVYDQWSPSPSIMMSHIIIIPENMQLLIWQI